VTCNPRTLLGRAANLEIVAEVGPEVVAGSTRMKAGTAQKMILNMLSTGAMTRLGYVYDNLMVNVHMKNEKLVERGIGILQLATGVNRETARAIIKDAVHRLPVGLVMLEAKTNRSVAIKALRVALGDVGRAIAIARQQPQDVPLRRWRRTAI